MKDDASSLLDSGDVFRDRHVGPRQEDISAMLKKIGLDSLESLIDQAVPSTIRFRESLFHILERDTTTASRLRRFSGASSNLQAGTQRTRHTNQRSAKVDSKRS